jgi:hypothetical protein
MYRPIVHAFVLGLLSNHSLYNNRFDLDSEFQTVCHSTNSHVCKLLALLGASSGAAWQLPPACIHRCNTLCGRHHAARKVSRSIDIYNISVAILPL